MGLFLPLLKLAASLMYNNLNSKRILIFLKTRNMKFKLTNPAIIAFTFLLFFTHIKAQQLGSLQFNGENNVVIVENSPLNVIDDGDFTLEAWIKGEDSGGFHHPTILSNRSTFPSGGGIMFFIHNQWGGSKYKLLSLQINEINYKFVNNGTFNGDLLDNKCHHVAVSRKGNILTFYADGIQFGTFTFNSGTTSLNEPLRIGQDRATNNTFDGLISQCRIWNIARTPTEIFQYKDVRLNGNENGLLAYWEMNETNGQILVDKTGQYNGILGNGNELDFRDPVWSKEGCINTRTTSTTHHETTAIKMYPVPATDFITIQYNDSKNINLEFINQTGQTLFTRTINHGSNEIDISFIPKGIYFIKLVNKESNYIKKIIVQ